MPDPDIEQRYLDIYSQYDPEVTRPIVYIIDNSTFKDIFWNTNTPGVVHLHFYNALNFVYLRNNLFQNYSCNWELLTFEATHYFEVKNMSFRDIPLVPKLYL